jgi:hypothetical protein
MLELFDLPHVLHPNISFLFFNALQHSVTSLLIWSRVEIQKRFGRKLPLNSTGGLEKKQENIGHIIGILIEVGIGSTLLLDWVKKR